MPKPRSTHAYFTDNRTVRIEPVSGPHDIFARVSITDAGCDVYAQGKDVIASFADLPTALAYARRNVASRFNVAFNRLVVGHNGRKDIVSRFTK